MRSLNYKAFVETLKYILLPSDSLLRRLNFTSHQPLCVVVMFLSTLSFQALKGSTVETYGIQYDHTNDRLTVCRLWKASSPLIIVIVKRPRYERKSRKESRALAFTVACLGMRPYCCVLWVNILRDTADPACGSENIFEGSSILSVLFTSHCSWLRRLFSPVNAQN